MQETSPPIPYPDELPRVTEALTALSKLGRFWVSPDLCARTGKIIPAYSSDYVTVVMERENHLPPINCNLLTGYDLSSLLHFNTRSRALQAGLHLHGSNLGTEIVAELVNSGQLIAPMRLTNLGGRPVRIEAGDGLAAWYSTLGADLLHGPQLADALNTHSMIKGEYGKDWVYTYHQGMAQENGIALRLKGERRYIPYGFDTLGGLFSPP